ncbi:MAG: hypothetical protein NTX65_12935 [Ignavibacteriales bacterium]|nr:hypothetical protein [Ignavibacteriales bacterium]
MNTNIPQHITKQKNEKPYWKRAHHDWKFWVAILLMLVAMFIYVKSNDLSMRPNKQMQQKVPY